jgi:hypothetical protein
VKPALVLVLLVLAPGAAWAHAVGLSTTTLRVDGNDVVAELAFARADLPDEDIAEQIVVESGGARCPGVLDSQRPVAPDGVALVVRCHCSQAPASLTYTLPFLESLGHGHRHLVTAGEVHAVLDRTSPSFSLAAPARAPFGRLLAMGLEHILTGIDHLVFLLGLLLVGGRPRTILRTITAFTVGHSITLACGALGLWTPSPRWVEPLIALSIAYVGIENLWSGTGEGRWRLALGFGMVHGFGFSGALAQLALPRAQLVPALLAFNSGVELGQLAVLAVVLPLLSLARRWQPFARYGRPVLSAAIVVPGLLWFVTRLG